LSSPFKVGDLVILIDCKTAISEDVGKIFRVDYLYEDGTRIWIYPSTEERMSLKLGHSYYFIKELELVFTL
jgi:hypothetical protein